MSLTLLWTNIWSHKNWIFFTQLGFENKRIYYISDFAKESSCFSLCYSFSRIVPVLRSITCLSWVFVWPSLFSTKSQPNQFQAPQMCFFSIRLLFFQQHHFLKNYSDTNRQNVSLLKFTTPRIFGSLILGKKRRQKIAERIKVSICLNKKGNIFKHWISRRTI